MIELRALINISISVTNVSIIYPHLMSIGWRHNSIRLMGTRIWCNFVSWQQQGTKSDMSRWRVHWGCRARSTRRPKTWVPANLRWILLHWTSTNPQTARHQRAPTSNTWKSKQTSQSYDRIESDDKMYHADCYNGGISIDGVGITTKLS